MSSAFVLTPEAADDVLAIWTYLADTDSEAAADRIVARLYDECDRLAATPGGGHYRLDLLDQRYRFWAVWSYLVVYRWESRPLQVIAIVHGARDLQAALESRG